MPEDFSELESRLTETARASLERAGLPLQMGFPSVKVNLLYELYEFLVKLQFTSVAGN